MKLLTDFFPILLFFIVYKLHGIYAATLVAMAAAVVMVAASWWQHKRFEKMPLITLLIITILGGATLIFRNEIFIKWKPTIVNWGFALVFLGSQYIGKSTLIEKMLNQAVSLPKAIWTRLNFAWVLFFVFMGCANVFVIYHFDTDAWVNFKLFGNLGLTIVFVILQGFYLAKYMDEESPKAK